MINSLYHYLLPSYEWQVPLPILSNSFNSLLAAENQQISPLLGKRKNGIEAEREAKKVKYNAKSVKLKRPGFSDERYNETSYYFENGLRKVQPYYFTFSTFTKGRWIGQRIIDVFAKEFRAHSKEEYERCLEAGTLTVNYEKVSCDYILRHNDLLANVVHRHEVPVTGTPIEIVHADEDLVVVDKPASIPVHPCGRYRHNTVVFILAKEHGLKNLRTIHRLDRLTSGILLFGRTVEKARALEKQIRDRQVSKEYVCRVEGEFPKYENQNKEHARGQGGRDPVECCEPIEVISYKIGVCKVSKRGKECRTTFERLSFNGKSSVVLCKPATGRMHQIRVHLQYLGFPIINDPLYNHDVFGPNKGKDGIFGKSDEKLIEDLIHIHNIENWMDRENESSDIFLAQSISLPNEIIGQSAVGKVTRATQTGETNNPLIDPNCYECRVSYSDPKPEDLIMYLHALNYKGPDWYFETQFPKWADESWNEN